MMKINEKKKVRDNLFLLLNQEAVNEYDKIESPEDDPFKYTLKENLRESLKNAMHNYLSPREEKVLKLFFGFNGKTYKIGEIADMLGISKEKAREMKAKALYKLQSHKDKFEGFFNNIHEVCDSKDVKDVGTPVWLILEQIFAERCIANGMSKEDWLVEREDGFGNNDLDERTLNDIWERATEKRQGNTGFGHIQDVNTILDSCEKEVREVASRIMEGTNSELPGNVKNIIIENGGKIKRFDVQETEFNIEWEINGEIHRSRFVLGKNMLNDNILKFAEDICEAKNKKQTKDSNSIQDEDEYEIIPINEVNENDIYELTDFRHACGVKNGENDLIYCSTGEVICPNFRKFIDDKKISLSEAQGLAGALMRASGKSYSLDTDIWVSEIIEDLFAQKGIEIIFPSQEIKEAMERQSNEIIERYNGGNNRLN